MKYRVYYWLEGEEEKRKYQDYDHYPEREITDLIREGEYEFDVVYTDTTCKYCGRKNDIDAVMSCAGGKFWCCSNCFEKLMEEIQNENCNE